MDENLSFSIVSSYFFLSSLSVVHQVMDQVPTVSLRPL